jgi:hypothetical protein
VNQAEDRGVGRERHRQGSHDRERDAGRTPQVTEAESQITSQSGQHRFTSLLPRSPW